MHDAHILPVSKGEGRMKPRPDADNRMPPWLQAKVDPASYMTVPHVTSDNVVAAALRELEERLLNKIRAAAEIADQAIVYLTTDAYGTPREPSQNEREAIECLHRIQQELRT
jgi:hypothetical protein